MHFLKPILNLKKIALWFTIFISLLFSLVEPTQAVNYTISFSTNAAFPNTGVVVGSAPTSISYAAGATVTVPANPTGMTRQGFDFAGWMTAADGTGTFYAAGSGTFTINASSTLYAKWVPPQSARLIGSGGSIISFTNSTPVTNGGFCIDGGVRGITSDGTYLFYRPSTHPAYICKMTMAGNTVEVSPNISTLSGLATDSLALTHGSGCIFIRPQPTGTASSIYCIDPTDWSMTSISLPTYTLYAGSTWLYGNLITFPDGRVGSVSAPGQSLPTGNGAGQCPSGMFCKVLRLFSLTGSGKNVTATFSEDLILADDVNGWPGDEHGIATDGTYLYEIRHASGYKVWALQSGMPSYLVYNADGTGTCDAATYTATSRVCIITYPIDGATAGAGALSNSTYLGRNHTSGKYLFGDYSGSRFYLSPAGIPPTGPGTLITESAFSAFGLAGGVTTVGYRGTIQINATVNIQSRVTFRINGITIVGCKNKLTTGSSPNITASCTWKTSKHGEQFLSATAVPVISGTSGATTPIKVVVTARTGRR